MSDHELFVKSMISKAYFTPQDYTVTPVKKIEKKNKKKKKTTTPNVTETLSLPTQENFLILSGFAKNMMDELGLMVRLEARDPKLLAHMKIYKKLHGMLPFADGDKRDEMEAVIQEHYPKLDEYYNKTVLRKRKELGLQYTPSDFPVDEAAKKRAKAEHDYDLLGIPALVSSVHGAGSSSK